MVLFKKTLVLNRYWVPIDVTTVKRALCLTYGAAAEIVDPGDFTLHTFDSWIARGVNDSTCVVRTVSAMIQAPEVVRLRHYGAVPRRTQGFSRKLLYQRDSFACQYCGAKPKVEELTIDHVLPKARGGRTTWRNCVTACRGCNLKKGDHTLAEVGFTLRLRPEPPTLSPFQELDRRATLDSWRPFLQGGDFREAV
jgi:5-methylcytosine-specific restriction endonuclease McrA